MTHLPEATNPLELVEAVYYPSQVPRSLEALTLLACVFDKVHFPAVYLPEEFDEVEAEKEWRRLREIEARDLDGEQMRMCLQFTLHRHHVQDLCFFSGTKDTLWQLEPGADELAKELELMLFGPPPENFFPTWSQGFSKGLPGSDTAINAPASLTYPANALLYAARLGLPVINDDPSLPVPAVPQSAARNNTKAMTTILALECVRLVLPKMPVLLPSAIAELRAETKKDVRPFRLSLLRLAGELNAMLASNMSMAEVQRAAQTLAETRVYPELQELRAVLENPAKPWHKRAVGLFKEAPDLATSFMALPTHLALAKLFAKFAVALGDLRDEQLEKTGKMNRSGFNYLLRLPEVVKTQR